MIISKFIRNIIIFLIIFMVVIYIASKEVAMAIVNWIGNAISGLWNYIVTMFG